MLDSGFLLHEFAVGDELTIGPFRAETRLLPHFLANAGIRLAADGQVLAYTGDTGPSPDVVALAREADLLLAEATYVDQVPEDSRRHLSSARQAGLQAAEAGVRHLVLTHLQPGADPQAARSAAGDGYDGTVDVATADFVHDFA
jgi:ribonuclease BN (tRNA processing enzyme)